MQMVLLTALGIGGSTIIGAIIGAKISVNTNVNELKNWVDITDEDDDDEIFVGEIEDNRKPERMMIGDGEEEEEMDFEFL